MKFDYGDSVQIAATSEPCEVVGVTAVESVQQAEVLKFPSEPLFIQLSLLTVPTPTFQKPPWRN